MPTATTCPIRSSGRTSSSGCSRSAGGCTFQRISTTIRRKCWATSYIQEQLQRFLPRSEPYEVVHRTLYTVHQRVAATFRVGRAILAGDAAHVMSPIGAMGMNSGVHDAVNLGEKLVAILRGESGLDVLDRYTRQRRHVAVNHTTAQTARNKKLLEEKDPVVRRRNHDNLRRTAADPALAREFLLRTSLIKSVQEAAAIISSVSHGITRKYKEKMEWPNSVAHNRPVSQPSVPFRVFPWLLVAAFMRAARRRGPGVSEPPGAHHFPLCRRRQQRHRRAPRGAPAHDGARPAIHRREPPGRGRRARHRAGRKGGARRLYADDGHERDARHRARAAPGAVRSA